MPRKPIKFELDFMIKDIFPRFTVKQFDDVSFNIKPLNQGLDYDTSNMIGKIFVGVNNDMFMQTTDITVSSDNINVLLDKNMLQKNGRAYAEIELTDEAGTITSSSFIFDIDPKIGEGGMIPGEYEGFVEKYERLISEFKAQINSSIDNSNNLIDKTIKNCNTSVDTKLSTVDSRLNSKVAEVDNKLNTVDSLVNTKITNINNTLNKKVSEVDSKLDTVDGLITAKVSDFERRFSALTSSQQQNSEVIDAREGEVSLKARLDKDIENPKKLYTSIEGTEISVDSLEGYLKDIEILGNTVQDQNNLADIRSVGDKLENQELYEIPVLSVKGDGNLFDNITCEGSIDGNNGNFNYKANAQSTNFIKVSPNMEYRYTNPSYGNVTTLCFYDSNKKFIKSEYGQHITTPSNCCYIRIYYYNGVNGVQTNNTLMINEGSAKKPYEPYQEYKLTILSPTPLEKVGDVADRIICKDGVWGVEKNIETLKLSDFKKGYIGPINNTGYRYSFELDNAKYITKNYLDYISGFTTLPYQQSWDTSSSNWFTEVKNDTFSIHFCLSNEDNDKLYGSSWDKVINGFINFSIKVKTTQPQFIPLPYDQQIALRTFANKTNISFGCEIEPTLKASIPKSLGASVSSNTTQIDNLSKELQKINNLEESVTSEVISESDFITVENTSNGYFEDVKLEGKTLVNLFNAGGYSLYNNYILISKNMIDFSKLKSNTVYTGVLFDNTNKILYTSMITNIADTNIFLEMYDKVFTFKTPQDLSSIQEKIIKLYAYADNVTKPLVNTDIDKIKFMILEGDHTQNPPEFFEGLKSVGDGVEEISVLSANENLFDGEFELGVLFNGRPIDSTLCIRTKNYIPIDSSCNYYFSNDLSYNTSICEYDYNYEYIGVGSFSGFIYKPSNNTNYIKFRTSEGSIQNNLSVKYMINKGDTPKPYQPPKQDKKRILYYNEETQTWEKPILRQWDSIEKHSDGKYYYHKRSGEVVLNGSENWLKENHSLEYTDLYRLDSGIPGAQYKTKILSNISDFTNESYKSYDKVGLYRFGATNYASTIVIRILKSNNIQQWLQSNNVTVVYQLAEEKVYECTNLDLITYSGETNLLVKSGVLNPKITLKVKKGIGNVVTLLQNKVAMLEDLVNKLIQSK